MGDRTSRDANDPRDELRAMNKRAREEMEDDETRQTGGQERPQRAADDEGVPASSRSVENATRDLGEARREPDASGRPRGEESGLERPASPRRDDA
jgi:hypothetical protein